MPVGLVDNFTFTTTAIPVTNSGSLALTPEKASTTTAGIVLRPRFDTPLLSSFSVSVDFYDIKISNVISTIAGNTALAKCYNQDGTNPTYSAANPFCALVSRDATGGISNVALPYLNLGGLKTRGVDLQLDWTARLGDLGSLGPAVFTLNSVVSYLDSYQIKNLPGENFREFRGTIDGTNALPLPKWRYTTTANLTLGNVDLGARWRHLDSMKDVTSVISPNAVAAGVPNYDVFDITARITVNEDFQLRLGVTNVTDKQPLTVGGQLGSTLPGTYDILGRSFYVGVKTKF